jgi:hypothetical protein
LGSISTFGTTPSRGATVRLLESLRPPDDARILGPQIVREITYHVVAAMLDKFGCVIVGPALLDGDD